jgi:hypothetical protein
MFSVKRRLLGEVRRSGAQLSAPASTESAAVGNFLPVGRRRRWQAAAVGNFLFFFYEMSREVLSKEKWIGFFCKV